MICETVHLTYVDDPGAFPDGRRLDKMIRCTAEATTTRIGGPRSPKPKYHCAPCAEHRDDFGRKIDAAILEARRKRGEICGEYAATDPYDIKPGDVCARWIYREPDDAKGLFEVLTAPGPARITKGSPLDDERPYTWMEEVHGRNAWQLRGRLIESGREGWVFYRNDEWIWRKEERKATS